MKPFTKGVAIAISMFFVIGQMNAQTTSTQSINVVTSAVPFLRISPDARAGGMGELGVATTPDVMSQFYNIAKYPFTDARSSAGITYTPWLKDLGLNDVFMATAAGYTRFGEQGEQAVSMGLRYFSLGNIQFTDNLGNDLNTFRPREFAFDLGYSRKLSDKLGLGVAIRYINSNLAGGQAVNGVSYSAGNSVAGDVGLYYNGLINEGNGFSGGLTLTNLGAKIGYTDDPNQKDFIPANLSLGTSYTSTFQEVHRVTIGLDVHKLLVPTPPTLGDASGLAAYRNKGVVSSWFSSFGDSPGGFNEEMREFYFSLGGEYWYNNQFAFRAGYFHEDKTKGNRQYLTMGAAIRYNLLGVNFSYLLPTGSGINRNPLSNTLRLGLTFDFESLGQ